MPGTEAGLRQTPLTLDGSRAVQACEDYTARINLYQTATLLEVYVAKIVYLLEQMLA